MWFAALFFSIVLIVVISYRDELKRKQQVKNFNYAQTKFVMQMDLDYSSMVDKISETILDLDGEFVEILRNGGFFWLVFIGGSVYCEMRWQETVDDDIQDKQDTRCILNRVALGKNQLPGEKNRIFAEMVLNEISKKMWLIVEKKVNASDIELHVFKNDYFVIPTTD